MFRYSLPLALCLIRVHCDESCPCDGACHCSIVGPGLYGGQDVCARFSVVDVYRSFFLRCCCVLWRDFAISCVRIACSFFLCGCVPEFFLKRFLCTQPTMVKRECVYYQSIPYHKRLVSFETKSLQRTCFECSFAACCCCARSTAACRSRPERRSAARLAASCIPYHH